jgi:two-component system, NarL family, sensor histidine kinase UhpB
MDLKWLLVRRITLVAFACFVAGAGLAIYRTASLATQQNEQLAVSVSRQLNLQLLRIDTALDIPKRFPDWDLVTSYALQPGQCVQLLGRDSAIWRSSCAGVDTASIRTPEWFLSAYKFFIEAEAYAEKPVSYRGFNEGTVIASFDPVATASAAWTTIAPLFGISALLMMTLCVVAYFVIDRALRPTREILAGLNHLAKGDLTSRLPSFRLTELNRISEVFNALVSDLSTASSERSELARKLVDAQECERRHIARELHDEIAQKLSALNALAACIRISAQHEGEGLEGEAKELEKMASALMISLRKTLAYLRPQEIDDLGLLQSLEGLVAGHNESSAGRTRYMIEASGDVQQLRAETNAHVYRIIQEALNNASKHANARHVKVKLNQYANAGRKWIGLAVTDDGTGPRPENKQRPYAGSGLIGMRERVLALSGTFDAGPLPGGGFGLHVEFPALEGRAS